mmetsp:Transcript_39810/g.80447  ORF Transcript_39810/g.80447 Transcript_39810/m.80447 type:complete len:314 (-) Transcript_39810:20-961(-)
MARLDRGVHRREGRVAAVLLQGLGVADEVAPDDVRRDDVLDLLREVLEVEAVVDLLHLADGGGDLRLPEELVEERVLEDAVQEGHVAQARAEAVPGGAPCLRDHQPVRRLRRPRGLALLRPLLGGLLRRGLSRGLGRGRGFARRLPLLVLLRCLVLVAQVGHRRGDAVHAAPEHAPGARRHGLEALGAGLQACPHEVPGRLQGLVLLNGLRDTLGGGRGAALRPVPPLAEPLGGARGDTLHALADVAQLLLLLPRALAHPLGGPLDALPVLLRLLISLHVFFHLLHHLLDEAGPPHMLQCRRAHRQSGPAGEN